MKALVYKNNVQTSSEHIKELWRLVDELKEYSPKELYEELVQAVQEVERACVAKERIIKGSQEVGFGVGKVRKELACDRVTSIIRQIKSVKAW